MPSCGLTVSRYSLLRQVTTNRSPGRSAALISLIAAPRASSGISSSPSRIGKISPEASSAAARVGSSQPSGGEAARAGWSTMSWVPSQSRRSLLAPIGIQEAIEARIGTGPPGTRRASRSRISRIISTVLPAPGSPSTTSRPVGTRASTSTSSASVPASSFGWSAQVGSSGGGGHPAPLVANFTSESQEPVREASAGVHETGSGYGSFRRCIEASASHCAPTAMPSWSESFPIRLLA